MHQGQDGGKEGSEKGTTDI